MQHFRFRFNGKSQRELEIAREHPIATGFAFHTRMNWIFELSPESSQELEFDLNISLKFDSLSRDLASTIA
jgi:hypothetical protein